MTEKQAKALSIKTTEYCHVLKQAWAGKEKDSICLQRIFTTCEAIRLAWWKNRKFVTRPADIAAIEWIPLFAKALEAGVFTEPEKRKMLKALKRALE